MSALDIPCKRPGVPVVAGPKGAVTYCTVTGCGWEYGPGLKTDVEQNAKWHRAAHRAAVPRTHIFKPMINRPGYHAVCYECQWETSASTTTRSDVQMSLDYHLSSVHGLVSC